MVEPADEQTHDDATTKVEQLEPRWPGWRAYVVGSSIGLLALVIAAWIGYPAQPFWLTVPLCIAASCYGVFWLQNVGEAGCLTVIVALLWGVLMASRLTSDRTTAMANAVAFGLGAGLWVGAIWKERYG